MPTSSSVQILQPPQYASAIYSTNPKSPLKSTKVYLERPDTKTYPIEHDNYFIHPWNDHLRGQILLILGQSRWVSIDVLRRGITERADYPPVTIIITVADNVLMSREMDSVIKRIQALLRASVWAGVWLEVQQGRVSRYTVNTANTMISSPNLGGSIGPEKGVTSGTLGGYVVLRRKGNPKRVCVLTAGHLFLGDSYPQDTWDLNGRVIVSSSKTDFDDSVDHMKAMIKDCDRNILSINSVTGGDPSSMSDLHLRKLAIQTQRKVIYRSKLNLLGHGPRRLGLVFATSGDTQDPSGCVLDWTLIDVDPDRLGENTMLPQKSFSPSRVDKFGDMDESGEVMKFGIGTQFTAGNRSHIKSVLNMPEFLNPVLEDCVVGKSVGGQSPDFAGPGDSGAWVLQKHMDGNATVVGLVWGGQADCSWSYVTPMNRLVSDICRRFGCSLEVLGDQVSSSIH